MYQDKQKDRRDGRPDSLGLKLLQSYLISFNPTRDDGKKQILGGLINGLFR